LRGLFGDCGCHEAVFRIHECDDFQRREAVDADGCGVAAFSGWQVTGHDGDLIRNDRGDWGDGQLWLRGEQKASGWEAWKWWFAERDFVVGSSLEFSGHFGDG
jgi:hypothetical protein